MFITKIGWLEKGSHSKERKTNFSAMLSYPFFFFTHSFFSLLSSSLSRSLFLQSNNDKNFENNITSIEY